MHVRANSPRDRSARSCPSSSEKRDAFVNKQETRLTPSTTNRKQRRSMYPPPPPMSLSVTSSNSVQSYGSTSFKQKHPPLSAPALPHPFFSLPSSRENTRILSSPAPPSCLLLHRLPAGCASHTTICPILVQFQQFRAVHHYSFVFSRGNERINRYISGTSNQHHFIPLIHRGRQTGDRDLTETMQRIICVCVLAVGMAILTARVFSSITSTVAPHGRSLACSPRSSLGIDHVIGLVW